MKIISCPNLIGRCIRGGSVAALLLPLAAAARLVTVGVGNGNALAFFPVVTSISVGDQVAWVWNNTSNEHSTTASGLWDSGLQAAPFSFTNTFPTAGNYSYFCTRHLNLGMTGEVIVAVAALPPTVTITNPPAGITLSSPASLTLAAAASAATATITNVGFFQNAVLLGNVPAAPFSFHLSNLSAANYAFSAVASANNGLTATNSIAIRVVAASPVLLGAPQFTPPGRFQFNYSVNTGLTYMVQISTNLLNWKPVATNPATLNPMIFTNPAASPAAFYRIELLPNP